MQSRLKPGISCTGNASCALFSRESRLIFMRIASSTLAKYSPELTSNNLGIQAATLLLLLTGLYAGLPHAFSQGTSNQTDADGSSKSDSNSVASAQIPTLVKHGHSFNRPYGYYMNPILEYVKADQVQRERITAVVRSIRGRIQPLTDEYKQCNQEFLNNLAHGEHSETIMDEQTHLGRLFSDITLSYCQMSLEVSKVLSPDQIVLYEKFKRQQGWTHHRAN